MSNQQFADAVAVAMLVEYEAIETRVRDTLQQVRARNGDMNTLAATVGGIEAIIRGMIEQVEGSEANTRNMIENYRTLAIAVGVNQTDINVLVEQVRALNEYMNARRAVGGESEANTNARNMMELVRALTVVVGEIQANINALIRWTVFALCGVVMLSLFPTFQVPPFPTKWNQTPNKSSLPIVQKIANRLPFQSTSKVSWWQEQMRRFMSSTGKIDKIEQKDLWKFFPEGFAEKIIASLPCLQKLIDQIVRWRLEILYLSVVMLTFACILKIWYHQRKRRIYDEHFFAMQFVLMMQYGNK